MEHAVSQSLLAYWDDLRRERAAPERAELDPAAIGPLLAYTFVVEAGGVRLRLSGTRLDALFGRDLRGASFPSLWDAVSAGRAERALAAARGGPVPVVGAARGGPCGRTRADLELLLLPLRGGAVLGTLAAVALPEWIGLLPCGPLHLAPCRLASRPAGGAPALRTPKGTHRAAHGAARRVAHLRVYPGGRPGPSDPEFSRP